MEGEGEVSEVSGQNTGFTGVRTSFADTSSVRRIVPGTEHMVNKYLVSERGKQRCHELDDEVISGSLWSTQVEMFSVQIWC